MSDSPLKVVAAFDFDCTLSYHDTLLPFLKYVKGPFLTAYGICLALPMLIGCAFRQVSRQAAKESVLSHTIKGMTEIELREKGKIFSQESIPSMLKPEGLAKLRWHQSQGHRCILISATLDVYLKPWAEKMGFQDLICTRLQYDQEGKATGLLKGQNCRGQEKVNRLLEVMGPKDTFELYAYGDSCGDKELLDLADHSFYREF